MVTYEQDEAARRHFDSGAAFMSGLLVGAIFLFFAKANPWSSFGLPTHMMGRPLFSGESPMAYVLTGAIQMVVSLVYAFIISGVVFRLRTIPAILTGGGIGLVLALLNYLVFRFLLTNAPAASESAVLLTHVAFGLIVAGVYKGFAIPVPETKQV